MVPGRPMIRRPSRLVLIVAVALIGAAAVGAWLWRLAGSSTPVSADAALADFRASGAAAGERPPGAPLPGVYVFRQSGTESVAGGPVDITRELPATAPYVITPMPGGYHESLRFSEEHVEEVRFSVGAGETRAVSRRTKVTFLGVGEDMTDDQVPPPLDHPADLRVGAEWDGRYRSGDVPIAFRSRVAATRPVTLDGRRVTTFVIRTESTTGGSRPGLREDEIWWAPSVALPARWIIRQQYDGDTAFEMDAVLELQSAVPRT